MEKSLLYFYGLLTCIKLCFTETRSESSGSCRIKCRKHKMRTKKTTSKEMWFCFCVVFITFFHYIQSLDCSVRPFTLYFKFQHFLLKVQRDNFVTLSRHAGTMLGKQKLSWSWDLVTKSKKKSFYSYISSKRLTSVLTLLSDGDWVEVPSSPNYPIMLIWLLILNILLSYISI